MNRYYNYLALCLCATVITILISVQAIPAIAHRPLTISEIAIAQSSTNQQVEQGRTLYRDGEYDEALAIWEQAAQVFHQQNDIVGEAMVLSNIALVYRQQRDLVRASEAIESSLNLLESNDDGVGQENYFRVLAQALNTQGSILFLQGQLRDALASWEYAESIHRQLENPEGIAQSTINQTQSLRALGLHRRAQLLLENLSTEFQDLPESVTQVALYRSLGEAMRLLGDFNGAEEQFELSLAIAKQIKATSELSAIYIGLGNTVRYMNEPSKREALAKAEDFYQQAVAEASSPLIKIQAQLNLLMMFVEQSKGEEAQKIWPNIQERLSGLPHDRNVLMAEISLAQRLIDLKESTNSANPSVKNIAGILADTANQAKELRDRRVESYALGTLGSLYEQTSYWPELSDTEKSDTLNHAQNLTEEAFRLATSSYAPEIAYRWHWQLGRIYEAQDNLSKAIAAYDGAYQTVQTLRKDLFAASPDIRFNFRDEVEELYRDYISALLTVGNEMDLTNLVTVRSQTHEGSDLASPLTPTELAKDTLTELQLADLENLLDCSLSSFDSFSLDETVDTIADRDVTVDQGTAIFYPIVLDDRIELLLKLPNEESIKHYEPTIIPRDMVEQTLKDLRLELERSYFSSKRGLTKAKLVYSWLLQKAEADLEAANIKTLVFVLDGELRNVPMATLHDGNQFLIEKYAIALALGNLRLPQTEPSKQFRVLAAGLSDKPVFEDPENNPFGPLPFVQQELDYLQESLPNTTELKNSKFTQTSLETALASRNYNVVHLATHGQFGARRDNTFILTAPNQSISETNTSELDNKIDLNELDTLFRSRDRNPIELLVLSACETASGDSREVLGMAGMAVQTGARTTLATLWNVDDSSTAELMRVFYDNLVNLGMSRVEALQHAQLHLMSSQKGLYRPSHWAPYVLIGDWR